MVTDEQPGIAYEREQESVPLSLAPSAQRGAPRPTENPPQVRGEAAFGMPWGSIHKRGLIWPASLIGRVKISVLHHGFLIDGGAERVTLSLLRALDRTNHDVDLRCVWPPKGVSFCGQDLAAGGPGAGAAAEPEHAPACQPRCKFHRVRLVRAPPGSGDGTPEPGLASEVRSLISKTGSDMLIVTDGNFMIDRTDAPRVLSYANSDLSDVYLAPSLGHLRRPFRLIRIIRAQPRLRWKIAMARDARASVIPNSESTARAYARAIGPECLEEVVYPPVDLDRFAAAQRLPKERRVATTGRFSPEKNYPTAIKVMRRVGARWDAVGNSRMDIHERYLAKLRRMAGPDMHFHVNAGEGELDRVLGGAKAYLHARPESFGIAVVEAVAAGCIPVVPDNSAHPETVPFKALRYGSTRAGAAAVKGALDGKHDGLLRKLRDHMQKFSEEAFQAAMLRVIERHKP